MCTELTILVGQRWGLVGTKLFPKEASIGPLEDVVEARYRDPPPVVRKADDQVLPGRRITCGRASMPADGRITWTIRPSKAR